MAFASIGPIEIHLPEKVDHNDRLAAEFPRWNMEVIYSKTGIRARHVAAAHECASDLGVAAAERLFQRHDVDRRSIDFLLFCTQTPDYPLPTTACLIQDRLGLPTSLMLEHLRQRLDLDRKRLPTALEQCGNTVSSTLPVLARDLRTDGRLRAGKQSLLIGFGVGFSWAGCVWTETWEARQSQGRRRKAA